MWFLVVVLSFVETSKGVYDIQYRDYHNGRSILTSSVRIDGFSSELIFRAKECKVAIWVNHDRGSQTLIAFRNRKCIRSEVDVIGPGYTCLSHQADALVPVNMINLFVDEKIVPRTTIERKLKQARLIDTVFFAYDQTSNIIHNLIIKRGRRVREIERTLTDPDYYLDFDATTQHQPVNNTQGIVELIKDIYNQSCCSEKPQPECMVQTHSDGCEILALRIAKYLNTLKVSYHFVVSTSSGFAGYDSKGEAFFWNKHVAVVLDYESSDGKITELVIDPFLFNYEGTLRNNALSSPLDSFSLANWKNRFSTGGCDPHFKDCGRLERDCDEFIKYTKSKVATTQADLLTEVIKREHCLCVFRYPQFK